MDKASERQVVVRADEVELEGNLGLVEGATMLVVFAHGSGSSRHSPRNRQVAQQLRDAGLSTLLFDLLTQREDRIDRLTRELRFDIDLLTRRMVGATDWVQRYEATQALAIGYFGSSTGAAAALAAAARRPSVVAAVVSRGGRPDLAGPALSEVEAPTLLIVGGRDVQVLELNRRAREHMHADTELALVEGATHLFEEPGTLEKVATLAANWFVRHAPSSIG